MTYPKLKPCPKCAAPGSDLDIWTYENGVSHVEHDDCGYLGPGGNKLQAIRAHNARGALQ